MPDEELQRRVDVLRSDCKDESGKAFNNFLCPILHIDEPVELCRGHVIPDAFKTCNEWVPQRKDIDAFYGSMAEAEFIGAIKDQSKSAFEKWVDPELNRRHRPRFRVNDVELPYYFPKEPANVPGHTSVKLVGVDGETLCNVVVKKSFDEMKALNPREFQVIVERDYRPAVIASVLKAAHLTLFQMLGYRHVFSPGGQYLAAILKQFYLAQRQRPRDELQAALAAHFQPLVRMVSQMHIQGECNLRGTVMDKRILACMGAKEGPFAMGVIVPAGTDAFCVWLPAGEGKAIDTYLGFLSEPPTSIAAKLLQFFPSSADRAARWATAPSEPFRIDLSRERPSTHAEAESDVS